MKGRMRTDTENPDWRPLRELAEGEQSGEQRVRSRMGFDEGEILWAPDCPSRLPVSLGLVWAQTDPKLIQKTR